jgi:hypothetical protein
MDISNQVTDGYKMKRGNYAVNVNDEHSDGLSAGITSRSQITVTYTRSSHVRNGQGEEGGVCDSSVRNRQQGTTMCQAHSLQGEPIQRGLTQQKEWGSWNLAVTVGSTRLVVTETNTGSARLCASQIRYLVRSVQVPSGKELVLRNESA